MDKLTLFFLALSIGIANCVMMRKFSDSKEAHDYIKKSNINATRIILDKDVEISSSNNHIAIKGISDSVMIETPKMKILLAKFNSVSLKLINSRMANDSDRPSSSSTQRPTETSSTEWKTSSTSSSSKTETTDWTSPVTNAKSPKTKENEKKVETELTTIRTTDSISEEITPPLHSNSSTIRPHSTESSTIETDSAENDYTDYKDYESSTSHNQTQETTDGLSTWTRIWANVSSFQTANSTIANSKESTTPLLVNVSSFHTANSTIENLKGSTTPLLVNVSSFHTATTKSIAGITVEAPQLRDSLLLKGSKKLEWWTEANKLNYLLDICLFNVTNADQATTKTFRPVLKEVCGFKFNGDRTFKILNWTDDQKYVDAEQWRDYEYTGSLDLKQEFFTLNLPLVYLHNHVSGLLAQDDTTQLFIKEALDKFPFLLKMSADDLLFNGYDEKILAHFQEQINRIGVNLYLPKSLQDVGILPILDQKRSKHVLVQTYNTGKENIDDIGQIVQVNGKNKSSCWRAPCNELKGTDGVVLSPLLKDKTSTYIYDQELSRSVELVEVPSSDPQFKTFEWKNTTFASAKTYEANACFQSEMKDPLSKYDGILKRPAICTLNVPVTYSNPHFKYADPIFENQIEIQPDKNDFGSKIVIDKTTGDFKSETRSLQVNYDTVALSKIRKMKRYIFPVYCYQDSVTAK